MFLMWCIRFLTNVAVVAIGIDSQYFFDWFIPRPVRRQVISSIYDDYQFVKAEWIAETQNLEPRTQTWFIHLKNAQWRGSTGSTQDWYDKAHIKIYQPGLYRCTLGDFRDDDGISREPRIQMLIGSYELTFAANIKEIWYLYHLIGIVMYFIPEQLYTSSLVH